VYRTPVKFSPKAKIINTLVVVPSTRDTSEDADAPPTANVQFSQTAALTVTCVVDAVAAAK
jgi:hypothetical protein